MHLREKAWMKEDLQFFRDVFVLKEEKWGSKFSLPGKKQRLKLKVSFLLYTKRNVFNGQLNLVLCIFGHVLLLAG